LGPYSLGPNDLEEQGIYIGDAKILVKEIPDESIDLILTDPVYQNTDDYRWLAETVVRVLKDNRPCLAFCGIPFLPQTLVAMQNGGLAYRWQIIWYRNNEIRQRGAPPGKNMYTPCLLFDKGKSKRRSFAFDIHSIPVISAVDEPARFKWLKPRCLIRLLLSNYSRVSDIVLDPFTGSSTVPAVCKMLGRQYLAFEIIPEVAEQGRRRVGATQPVIFPPRSEQLRIIKKEE